MKGWTRLKTGALPVLLLSLLLAAPRAQAQTPSQPAQTIQPALPAQPVQPSQPSQPAQPSPSQPNQPAEPSQPAPPPAPAPWVPRQVGELRLLDKISAQATPLTLTVGQSVTHGSLTITLRACLGHPPDVPADSAAFLDIVDSKLPDTDFHGWMFANEPALGVFANPTLDVRLTACHD